MKPLWLLILSALLCSWPAFSQSLTVTNPPASVTLSWDPEPATNNIVNYKVYWGAASGTYTNALSAGTNTSATVSNLIRGATYYFAATATSMAGTQALESAFSLPVWTNAPAPPPPPTVLRIILN